MNWALPSLFSAKSHSASLHMIVCTQCAAQRSHSNLIACASATNAWTNDPLPTFHVQTYGIFHRSARSLCGAVIFIFFVFVCGHKFPDAGRGKIPKWYCPRLLTRKVNTIIETRENTRYIPISVSLALIMRAIPWKKWPAQMSDSGNNRLYYRVSQKSGTADF